MCTTMPGRVEGGDLLNKIEVMQLVYMTIKNGWLNYILVLLSNSKGPTFQITCYHNKISPYAGIVQLFVVCKHDL